MTDFLLRLVQSARGAPSAVRADVPARVPGIPIEIDEEIDAPSPAVPKALTPTVVHPPLIAPEPDTPRRSDRPAPLPPASVSDAPSEEPAPSPRLDRHPLRPVVPTVAPSPHATPPESQQSRQPAHAPDQAAAPAPAASPAALEPRFVIAANSTNPINPQSHPDVIEHRLIATPVIAREPALQLSAPHPTVASAEQVVRISIGRIEVRAAPSAAPSATPTPLARPRQSLDEHLAGRDRRRR